MYVLMSTFLSVSTLLYVNQLLRQDNQHLIAIKNFSSLIFKPVASLKLISTLILNWVLTFRVDTEFSVCTKMYLNIFCTKLTNSSASSLIMWPLMWPQMHNFDLRGCSFEDIQMIFCGQRCFFQFWSQKTRFQTWST